LNSINRTLHCSRRRSPIDQQLPANLTAQYSNWGRFALEPNGFGREACVLAKHTEAFYSAWGWADSSCTSQQVFMCKMTGEGHTHSCCSRIASWETQGGLGGLPTIPLSGVVLAASSHLQHAESCSARVCVSGQETCMAVHLLLMSVVAAALRS
jgi:hypothetical protein